MIIRNIIVVLFLFLIASCKKDVVLAKPVYPEGAPLLVTFSVDRPVPNLANVGGAVTFKIKGLKDLKEKFSFLLGTDEAEIISYDEESITVRVPANAITSNGAIKIGTQVYYGPLLKITGGLQIDPNFSLSGSRSNGVINGMVPVGSDYFLYGGFTQFNDLGTVELPMRGVVRVNATGNSVSTQSIMNRVFDGGQVRSMMPTTNSMYFVAGDFTSYFQDYAGSAIDRRFDNIFGLARVYDNGTLDTTIVDIINEKPNDNPLGGKDTVSALNGGVDNGNMVRGFIDKDGKYVVVGNFLNYKTVYYPASTATAAYVDRVLSPNNIRLNADGSFDSSYNYNPATKTGYAMASGNVLEAAQLSNDDIIVVGTFNSYQNLPVGYVAKIKSANGRVDPDFNSGKSGANGPIQSVTYNAATQKILLAGTFTKYNNTDVNGVVMIDVNGDIDPSFQFKKIKGGIVSFAKQIPYKNIIVVSGSFTHYNDNGRPGLVFLDATGNMIPDYNRFGLFSGYLKDVVQVNNTSTGLPSLFLVGGFNRFDNTEVGNFLKINFTK